MTRSLRDVIASLPAKEQRQIEARVRELTAEIEGLKELRRIAGKAQSKIARTLEITQPSVSKIEKQADMYVSTLRSFVEAVGGKLELIVRLPSHPPLRLEGLGDLSTEADARPRSAAARARPPRRIAGAPRRRKQA